MKFQVFWIDVICTLRTYVNGAVFSFQRSQVSTEPLSFGNLIIIGHITYTEVRQVMRGTDAKERSGGPTS